VAAVLTLPLRPAEIVLAAAAQWLRPPENLYPVLSADAANLAQERDALQGELDRERIRSAALETQLAEFRVVMNADTRGGWRPVLARVVERPSGRRARLLGLNVGATQGVSEGDPVVVGGNRLVGRIYGPVDDSRAWVVPIDDSRIGRIDALVFPAGRVGTTAREGTMIQLRPQGGGLLVGELERAASIQPGDVVLLNDPTWKGAAVGMRVGTVERTGTLDANPLRAGITVRMEVDPTRIGNITVKVADPNAPALRAPGGSR
jgi:cell shape-determining protein MreC